MEKTIIIDIPVSNETEKSLESFGLTLVHSTALARKLVALPLWQTISPEKALLVFPGSGARDVLDLLPKNWLGRWRYCTTKAKRLWVPGEAPTAFATRVYAQGMILGVKDIVVVDDVVSSGATAELIRRINSPWIPGASWHAATWIAQRSASLKYFRSLAACHLVGTAETKWPINSLSTLARDMSIGRSYATRRTDEPERFIKLLEQLHR